MGAFDEYANNGLLDQWYVVVDAADLAQEAVGVTVLGRSFVLWRDMTGRVVGAVDRCPHREAPLSNGRVEDGCIVCPYHEWAFRGDGRCERIPSSPPEASIPPRARLDVVAVRERYGMIWLCPGDPDGEPPVIVEDADPTFRRITAGMESWAVSATRMTDNFCDVAHFPFVHAATIGGDTEPIVDAVDIEQFEHDFVGYRYSVEVLDERGVRIGQDMSTAFRLPFTVRSNTTYTSGPRTGQRRVLLLLTTPVGDDTSLFTFIVWRNHDHDVPADELLAFDRAIGAEDKRMLETIPGSLPLIAGVDRTVSTQADRLSVRWRRDLVHLIGRQSSTHGLTFVGL